MGKTLSEKILSHASDKDVFAGDTIITEIDYAMAHDGTAPLAIQTFTDMDMDLANPDKIVLVIDHVAPSKSEGTSNLHNLMREFATKHGIKNFYDVGEGISHQLLLEDGFAAPGRVIAGADSHTCTHGAVGAFATGVGSTDMAVMYATNKLWLRVPETIRVEIDGELPVNVSAKDIILMLCGDIGSNGATYKALEFHGPTVTKMNIADRITLCNMVVEMGATTGLIEPDKKTKKFLEKKVFANPYKIFHADEGASYVEVRKYDVSNLEPQIACPHHVDNVHPISEVQGIKIDQVFLGSCTNGRYEDLKRAANILEGESVAQDTRLIILPASKNVFRMAMKTEVLDILLDAGGVICSPGCGACVGTHLGVPGPGERCLATTNRNFQGRMGCNEAEIYLGSPETAAYTAITGEITNPGG